jgi:opacity protein-like surface antigen
MTFLHRTISLTVLAIALAAVSSAAAPAQAQQPGNPIWHNGAVRGAAGTRPAVGAGVGQPAISGHTGISGGHNFNAGIVRPPNLSAGIASPNINPRIVQPQGINRFGGFRNHGIAGSLHNPGIVGGPYNNGYNTGYNNGFTGNRRLFHGHYGHYRLAPFDYPAIVPDYSDGYGGAAYSDYQGTCRVRWVKIRVRVHHHYHIRRVRRRICW